jgi:Colicin V production protein
MKLPVNMFDVALVVVLMAGVFRGRKQGMSEELLGLLKWLAIVIGCAMLYDPLGRACASSGVLGLLSSYLIAYIAVALMILAAFGFLKRAAGGKLLGGDFFGRSEYYLGMVSGMVRYGCVLLAALALLNARAYSRAEVQAMRTFQDEEYGKEYFPTLQTVQSMVFDRSLAGPWIKDNLGFLLIKRTPPDNEQFHQRDFTMP